MIKTRLVLAFGFLFFSCRSPLRGSPGPKAGSLSEMNKSSHSVEKSDIGNAKSSENVHHRVIPKIKKVHDVFSMGPYRVDLISLKEECYAEIYGYGDPAHGPNLSIPLKIKEPCFVRRRVLRSAPEKTDSRLKITSPLGGAHIFRQKDGSSELLVTMVVGQSATSNGLDYVQPLTSLRCGRNWVFFSARGDIFRVSTPKTSEKDFCALRVYVDRIYDGGFDQAQLGEKEFKLPKKTTGRVTLDDD